MPLMILDNGHKSALKLPASLPRAARKVQSGFTMVGNWLGLWTGAVRDEDAAETVIATTATALMSTMEDVDFAAARKRAAWLWKERSA